jgi:phosphoribosylcarboxyaminoimidazole (NCAIR) mutase
MVAEAARAFDKRNNGAASPKVLETPLSVFHESRCGSTLVANILQAASPVEHRVYSEHPGPLFALQACGEDYKTCSLETAASIFRDTIYIMSRTGDSREKRAFFKIQSVGSKHISVFQRAFPDTPWIYVYREGVEVMMSHLSQGTSRALCVSSRRNPGRMVEDLAQRHRVAVKSLSDVEYCALHLSALTESAAESLDEYAIPVNYRDLPGVLYEKILPAVGVPIGDAEIHRIEHAAQTYAKGSHGRYKDFKEDTEKKESTASKEVKEAAARFLAQAFDELEVVAAQRKAKDYQLP